MKNYRGLNFLPGDVVYDEMDSPVGKLTIIASSKGLHAILWDTDQQNLKGESITHGLTQSTDDEIILKTKLQLNEYFAGKRKTFNLPLVLEGTDFQIQVWQQLLQIPYATTLSYGQQAEKVGNKNKARAVGMANGLNPISIIVPCHRVIGSNGKLVGFGGGLDKKDYLLTLEKANVNRPQ
ncbi:MAG: methylated-DNA--[protein]-cysteine S-methyltransferase [Legionellales bacterium]|nr:methylated-DNA--[protein]-cysteine S-methyltransferase [Legionellales bacterium]